MISKADIFDSITNDTVDEIVNEKPENSTTYQVVAAIVDEMENDATNLTSTVNSFEKLPINNTTNNIPGKM